MKIDDQRIQKILGENLIFSMLKTAELDAVAEEASLEAYRPGEMVVQQGAFTDGYFVIVSGKAHVVDVEKEGLKLASLKPGDGFGEQSLLFQSPAGASVKAASHLKLMRLSTPQFRNLIRRHPEIETHCREVVRLNEAFNSLKKLEIFSALRPGEIVALLGRIEEIEVRKGGKLFHEGEEGGAAFVVRSGKIRIVDEAKRKTLSIAGEGAIIGEMSLINDRPRLASAIAMEDSSLYQLRREIFLETLPKIQDAVGRILANRALQSQAFSAERQAGEEAPAPEFRREEVKLRRGWRGRSVCVTTVSPSSLAGLACVDMVLRTLKKDPPAAWKSWVDARVQRAGGETLFDISGRLEESGFHTRLARIRREDLPAISFPAVIEDDEGKPCVLFGTDRGRVWTGHPEKGLQIHSQEEFFERWNGEALTAQSVPEFGVGKSSFLSIYSRYLPLILPHKSLLAWILASSVFLMLLGLAAPFFTQTIIDKVLTFQDKSALNLMLAGMVFVTLFQLLGSAFRTLLNVTVMQRMEALVTTRLFNHILSLPLQSYERFKTGEYAVRFDENRKLLRLLFGMGISVSVDVVAGLYYLLLLFGRNPGLTALGLAFVLGFAALMAISSPKLRANDRQVFDATSRNFSFMLDAITGIQTVKSLTSEERFYREGMERLAAKIRAEIIGVRFGYTVSLISQALFAGASISLLAYGASEVIEGKMTVGEYVAFNAIYGLLLAPIARLVAIWDQVQEARVSYERVNDVLEMPAERSEQNHELTKVEGNIRLENASFRYEGAEKDAVSDVTLEIKAGWKVALVGRSGCGKSSLVKLIMGFYKPVAGKIYIDNIDVETVNPNSLRRHIGVVEQRPFLFRGTVRDNIAKADPDLSHEKVDSAAALAGVKEFTDRLPQGLDTPVGEGGASLSGGQAQRVAIARALIRDPAILVLDEATSALDNESERTVQRNLDELMRGRTTLIIAHRLSSIVNSDRIVVMDQGRLVEMGTHAELMEKKGFYHYLYMAAEKATA